MPTKKTTEGTQAPEFDAAIAMGQETVEQVFKASEKVMEAGQKVIGTIDAKKSMKIAREQLETASKTMFPGQDHLTTFGMATFDAYATAFEAFTQGTERLGAEVAAFARKSMETSVENGKTLMACKSVNEAFDLRNEITRAAFDTMVSEGAKLTELSFKTATESLAPIQDHARKAFDKFGAHAA